MAWFLLGAPWDCSGTNRGEHLAPDALRAAGLADLIDVDLGDAATVISTSDRDPATGVRALGDTVAAAGALAAALADGIRKHPGRRPVIIGGDCSLLLGVFTRTRAALWIVDGHPDFSDAEGSDTGETADMELAMLTGYGPPVEFGVGVPVEHVALIGHRTAGLDAASAAEVARLPAGLFTLDAPEVIADPHGSGMRAAAWADRLGDLPVWLHVDVDVLDASALPAVTYPQAGGPDFEQLAALLAPLAAAPRLIGISIADFRPDLDPTGRYARELVALLGRLL